MDHPCIRRSAHAGWVLTASPNARPTDGLHASPTAGSRTDPSKYRRGTQLCGAVRTLSRQGRSLEPPVAPPCSICAFLISVSASGLSARRGDAVEASAAASLVASGHGWPDRWERVAAGHSHDDVSSHGAGDVDGPWVSQAELAQVACPLCSSRGSVRRRGGWEARVRAVVYDRYGGPEVLRVADVPMPSPGAGQVRVRVVATSVNLSDWETLRGSPLYARLGGLRSPARATLGSDIAGWVDAVGEGVTRFRPGDEVYGDNLALKGGFADYTVAAASALTPKPAELTFAQASTIPQAGAIALQGTDGAAAGRRVLINGGGGGSGSFAIQLAKRLGAHVTGVDNAGKRDFMRSLGADQVIDYRSEDFTRRNRPHRTTSRARPRPIAISGDPGSPHEGPNPPEIGRSVRRLGAGQSAPE